MFSQPPGPEGAAPEHLQGSVERVTFHSPESGFCVLRVKRPGSVKRLTNLQARLRQAVPGDGHGI